ncbi:peptidylprolyl isomerase [Leifsonia sp. ZF2019]|uniref:peptidylprolyl isomerase n=1 Tax=Leifsonia sp. ZF2019 TaxID=2781978 RepID=UPI001CBA9C7B|nr:peptidylprolyl isomerase [Leifsonia sp. ZF2019]UAJ77961.1 peptidylprolyl isomerase [Leifsonia sp. ZF2019]
MAPSKQNDRDARQARERLRAYQARQTVHGEKVKRRTRDNWIAGIAVVVIVGLAVATQLLYFTGGPGAPTASASPSTTPTPTPAATGSNTGDVPSASIAEGRDWTGSLVINGIDLGVTLDGKQAPQAVSSTISLAKKGFYDGLSCHRLTTSGIFVLQCGDPKGDGSGGPGYSYGPVENAPADGTYPAGTIAMARQSGNGYSQGSQFFIVYKDSPIPSDAAGGYTVLGRITSGLDTLTSDVVAKGVEGGGTDGKPSVATKIDSFTLQ